MINSRRSVFLILACIALTLAGCGRWIRAEPVQDGSALFVPPPVSEDGKPTPTQTSPPLETQPPANLISTPLTQPTLTPAADIFSEDPSLPRSRYVLDAVLDYDAHEVEVFQSLTYVNRASEVITDMVLLVEPERSPGAFDLEKITWADGSRISNYQLEDGVLTIPLPSPLPSWKSLGLELEYSLKIPGSGGTFGYSERQLNLGDWYPLAPIYRPGHGWLAHSPSQASIGEHLTYDIADFEVEVRLRKPPEGLIIAASAPPTESGLTYRYQVTAARNFTLTASPHYQVIAEETGRVPVRAYVFEEHLTAGEAAVVASSQALDLFSEIYGTVPRTELTIVEGEFADGMEYDGLYFLGWSYFETYFGGSQNFLTTLSVHETAHMWWAGLTANDQALEPWLDEAFATLSEKLYFERYHPDQVDWWWEFRVALYEPDGWVDTSIYDHSGFRPYVNAAYLRGVSFLEEARQLLGDEVFFTALRSYLDQNSYGDGTTDEFLGILAEADNRQLDGLITKYFRTAQP